MKRIIRKNWVLILTDNVLHLMCTHLHPAVLVKRADAIWKKDRDTGMKKAVALKYETHLPAPFVIAKGKGELALKIKEIAENNNVGLVYDEELADNLEMIEIGSFIPEEYYRIIAEIFVFLGRLEHS